MASRLLAAAGAPQHPQWVDRGNVAAKGSGELLVYVRTDSGTAPVTVDAGGTVGCLMEAVAAALRLDRKQVILTVKGQPVFRTSEGVALADTDLSQEECIGVMPVAGRMHCCLHSSCIRTGSVVEVHESRDKGGVQGMRKAAGSIRHALRTAGRDEPVLKEGIAVVLQTTSRGTAFFDPPMPSEVDTKWTVVLHNHSGLSAIVGITTADVPRVGDALLQADEAGFGSWLRSGVCWAVSTSCKLFHAGESPPELPRVRHDRTITITLSGGEAEFRVGIGTHAVKLPPASSVRLFVSLEPHNQSAVVWRSHC
eukprot:TRINITY_DN7772_c0_g2_i3.p1 TRINITY_DN7772_c0_g2~~TRINITY_DN7772_c0_g2_i3.p1  ORF type:complete len:330 (+),score=64.75 TRINITY_DN7772_c0_g2_i3:63-992(+)